MGCASSKPALPGTKPAEKGWELTAENTSQYDAEKAPHSVSRRDQRRDISFAATGPASAEMTPAWTMSETFKKAAEGASKDKVAVGVEWPVPAAGAAATPLDKWRTWSWGEYYQESYDMARAVVALGAAKLDGSVIYGFNSPFWIMAQMSSILASVLPAGIYPTDTVEQIQYKTQYADAAVAFCGTQKNYDALCQVYKDTPDLKAIITWDYEAPVKTLQRDDGSEVKVMTWAEALALGREQAEDELNARIEAQDARDCCALVFTSGTTGKPKAVMLSHDNMVFAGAASVHTIEELCRDGQERALSYLPLSHVAGQEMDIILPMYLTATRPHEFSVYFARESDLKAGTLVDRLTTVHPTAFLGVPRVYEKIMAKMKAKGASVKGLKKKVVTFCKGKGLEYQRNLQVGGSGAVPGMYNFAEKKVLSKVKEALGFDELKLALTGAAPMPIDVQEYFASLGFAIMDAYGASECCGATTANTRAAHQFGTVGQTIPGMECRVFRVADDDNNNKTEAPKVADIFANHPEDSQGELCFRGRHVMMGYLANPKLGEEHVAEIEKKNEEVIDREGFYHSGDKGVCSSINMFRITGRYKELIIGAGGENIAPVPVEDNVKKLAPGISNAIMVGDKRKFNAMLITLKAEGATGELPGNEKLDPDVRSIGSEGTVTIEQAMKDPKWIKHIQDAIQATNEDGSVCQSNAWKVGRFTILPRDVSIVSNELTPTLKLKRSFVNDKFQGVLDHMYGADTKDMYVPCPLEKAPGAAEAAPAAEPVAADAEAKPVETADVEAKPVDAAEPAKTEPAATSEANAEETPTATATATAT